MSERIPAALRRRVAERAHRCCEYCGVPDIATLLPHEPDHIVAIQHGGKTTFDNLAYACFECNRHKGHNLTSVDPLTGAVIQLYRPRQHLWTAHFDWHGAVIGPKTEMGRATASLLRFNHPDRIGFRENLLTQGYVLGPHQNH